MADKPKPSSPLNVVELPLERGETATHISAKASEFYGRLMMLGDGSPAILKRHGMRLAVLGFDSPDAARTFSLYRQGVLV